MEVVEDASKKIIQKEHQKDFSNNEKPKCKHCNKEYPNCLYSETFKHWMHEDCNCEESIKEKIEEGKEKGILEILKEKSKHLFEMGIGKRFLDKGFDNFNIDTANKKKALKSSIEFVKNYVSNPEKTKGLLFIGKPGTGKTHLCCSIISELFNKYTELFLEKGFDFGTYDNYYFKNKILMINVLDMLNNIKDTYQNDKINTEGNILKKYCNIPILILDDLGKSYSKINSVNTTWADEKLYKIINHRYENEKTIIVTTNFSIKELEQTMDNAIVSRLIEMCEGIKFEWEDYRKQKQYVNN